MTALPLVYYPDPRLTQVSIAVEKIDDRILALLGDMRTTMIENDGIGLAAVQVGVMLRLVVIGIPADEETDSPEQSYSLVNPQIVDRATNFREYEEGCLSIPDMRAIVERPDSCTISYLGTDGKAQTLICEGLLSTAAQHELDHLDGKLFPDLLTPLKRRFLYRRYARNQQESDD